MLFAVFGLRALHEFETNLKLFRTLKTFKAMPAKQSPRREVLGHAEATSRRGPL